MLTGFCRTLYKSKNSNGDISCFFNYCLHPRFGTLGVGSKSDW